MLGDTPYDLDACQAAGVRFIGFRCGGWDDSTLNGAAKFTTNRLSCWSGMTSHVLGFRPAGDNKARSRRCRVKGHMQPAVSNPITHLRRNRTIVMQPPTDGTRSKSARYHETYRNVERLEQPREQFEPPSRSRLDFGHDARALFPDCNNRKHDL